MEAITSRTASLTQSLEAALAAVEKGQASVNANLARVSQAAARLPRLIDLVSLALTLGLVWFIIAQVSLLLQAWAYLRRGHVEEVVVDGAASGGAGPLV